MQAWLQHWELDGLEGLLHSFGISQPVIVNVIRKHMAPEILSAILNAIVLLGLSDAC